MLNPSPERKREGERKRGREGEGEKGRVEGGREREGERGREREREGREGKRERGREGDFKDVYTRTCKCIHTPQADMHTHCVPIIMNCIPTLREISVTTRADKVFLMPAQVLGSDTWLQRERETDRMGTNRNNHTVRNINNNFMYVCVCVLYIW